MEKKKNIWFDCSCIYKEKIYAPTNMGAMIVKIDPETLIGDAIIQLPGTSLIDYRVVGCVISYRFGIILLPDKSDNIYILDLKTRRIDQILIKEGTNVRLGMYIGYCDDEFIYTLSSGLNKILKINMKTKIYSVICDMSQYGINKCINKDFFVINNTIYFMYAEKKYMLSFDTVSQCLKVTKIESMYKPNTICIYNNHAVMTSQDKFVGIYNIESGKVERKIPFSNDLFGYECNDDNCIQKKYFENNKYDRPCFQKSLFYKNYILFIPYYLNDIMYMDMNDYTVHKICVSGMVKYENLKKNEFVTYRSGVILNNQLIIYTSIYNCYLIINLDNMSVNICDLTVEYDNLIYEKEYMQSHIIYEEKGDLNKYINFFTM